MTTTVDLDDVSLACLTAGFPPGLSADSSPQSASELSTADLEDSSRPLAICAHGFPDSAHTWRHLTPALVAAGFRVVAPFLRGYAPSSVSTSGTYQTGASSVDLCALHEHFGGDERAVLIGHDWGAPIVYGAATYAPERWARVVAMAVPPGASMGHAFLTNPTQLKRSWYMFFFQHGLADIVVPADDMALIDMLWADWSPGYDASEDLAHVKAALGDPAHLAAALGYYRASIGAGFVDPDLADAQAATQAVPTQPLLYLHGSDDGCIGAEVAASARAMVGDDTDIEIFDGLGHFLHLEAPDLVNQRIVEFLT